MTLKKQEIAVVGAGAVGSYFGAMLARAGHPVTLIGRKPHVDAITTRGLQLQMAGGTETVQTAATTELSAVAAADLVLFCVKSTDTLAVAAELAGLLKPDALVLSLQNGVDNAAMIASQIPQTVVPAVVYVATAMPEAGVVQHFGRGDLVIGALDVQARADPDHQQKLQAVVDLFATAGVPVVVSDQVIEELWRKLLVNCVYNAISAVAQLPYGSLVALPEIRDLMNAVMLEVIAVAQADGHHLEIESSAAAISKIGAAMPAQFSSTAQDLARGKPTEIDHLNGFVMRRGAELGVPTPINQTLHALVKLAETAASAR